MASERQKGKRFFPGWKAAERRAQAAAAGAPSAPDRKCDSLGQSKDWRTDIFVYGCVILTSLATLAALVPFFVFVSAARSKGLGPIAAVRAAGLRAWTTGSASMSWIIPPRAAFFAKCTVVGLLWGGTNPLLRSGSAPALGDRAESDGAEGKKCKGAQEPLSGRTHRCGACARMTASAVVRLFTEWRFVLPFCLNQLGSVLYVGLLGSAEMSVVVPTCNALTFIFTAVVSTLIGEDLVDRRNLLVGSSLILTGIVVCLSA
jgi:hypothetical protein